MIYLCRVLVSLCYILTFPFVLPSRHPTLPLSGKFSKAETNIIVDAVKVYAKNNDVSIEVSFVR